MKKPPLELRSDWLTTRKSRWKKLPFELRTVQVGEETQQSESERKGDLFEEFVVSRFNPEYFTLLDWRSDKKAHGITPLSTLLPDLEYHFECQNDKLHFAVECKFRKFFTNDSVDWARADQLNRYKQFEKCSEIPVFIVLGIGGEASWPNEVYSIPLKEISTPILHSMSIKPFLRKNPFENFFLNCSKLILT